VTAPRLTSLFFDSNPGAAANERSAPEAFEDLLSRLLAAARAAWPTVSLPGEAFVRLLGERAARAGAAPLERLHTSDLFLAGACAAGDPAALTALEQSLLAPLPAILVRSGVAKDVAEEAVQGLRERLLVDKPGAPAKIAEYDGRGPLAGFLRVAAVRAASNARRDESNRATLVRANGAGPSLVAVDPELQMVQQRYGAVFQQALADAFAVLSEEERNTLRLYFQEGLNLDGIGRLLGLSRATIGRRMISGREKVLEETLRLLGERIKASPEELRSLLGAVRSKLDVSLGALLGKAPKE
jgi:RNA polymerase sigma-70 factor (ECF subfamily)